ncbi:MAG: hypothetical protein A2144_05010 [Chloroflexi bacterium RBG_16_50_9]|nr:MAG: hypothetical protein A2144_05010 [Chloroflexi bacterium RBG_16_50_9]
MSNDYPPDVWEMKGLTREVAKLCKACERTAAACNRLSSTFDEFIAWSEKCTLQWRYYGLEESEEVITAAYTLTGREFSMIDRYISGKVLSPA